MAIVMRGETIQIEGLAAFQRELAASVPAMAASLKACNLAAAQMIEKGAVESARAIGSTAAHAFVEGESIRARGQARGASVTLYGQGSHPEIFGAEFGANQYAQFKPWRGNQFTPDLWDDGGAGYVLMPTIRAKRDEVLALYREAVWNSVRFAFPE